MRFIFEVPTQLLCLDGVILDRLWETSREGCLKQIDGVGEAISGRLAKAGIKTFDDGRSLERT